MHICVIFSTPFPPREGIGNYVYNMSKMYINKGYDVTLITRGGLMGKSENFEGINIFKPIFVPCYPFHVNFHEIFVKKLFKKLESTFDIVHIHSPLAPMISTKLPIVSTIHTPSRINVSHFEATGIFSYLSKAQCKVSYILEQKLLKNSDILTVVSNTVAQELIDEYGVEKERIKIVYNGVDEKIFIPINSISEKNYILFTGGLTYRKGLFDLIECGRYICDKYPDISIIIVGRGILRDKLQVKIKKLGLDKRFIFKGYVQKTELISLYQNAKIYVLPSHYEGLPTVLLEAMSCGLPVVATAVSGNLDVISQYKNGILVPSKSPKELANAISFLLDNDDLRIKFGKNARKTIEEHFTWKIISNKIMEYYNNLL